MYPNIEILDTKGELIGQQAMNDNLATQEQVNRAMLAIITLATQRLTNDKHALDTIVMSGDYDQKKLSDLFDAVNTLKASVESALATFEAALNGESAEEGSKS